MDDRIELQVQLAKTLVLYNVACKIVDEAILDGDERWTVVAPQADELWERVTEIRRKIRKTTNEPDPEPVTVTTKLYLSEAKGFRNNG